MISRKKLENNQVWLYTLTQIIAAGIGFLWPAFSASLDDAVSFVLAVLMYSMFTQIPFSRLKEALANRRFIYALLIMNYVNGTRPGLGIDTLSFSSPRFAARCVSCIACAVY